MSLATRARAVNVRERLERLKGKDRQLSPLYQSGREVPLVTRLLRSMLSRWTSHVSKPRSGEEQVRERLMRAGFPLGLRAREFIFLRHLLAVLGLGSFFGLMNLIGVRLDNNPLFCVLYSLAGAFLGLFIPNVLLNSAIRKRQRQVQANLPDFIDLLTVSVEAGLALDAALQRVSGQFPGALGEEGRRIVGEIRVGRTRAEAMKEMARRLDIPELTSLVTSIVQAELMGATMGNALRIQSQQIREGRMQRAREKAQQAPVKITVVLIFLIMPTLGIVIIGPTLIEAWNNLSGLGIR